MKIFSKRETMAQNIALMGLMSAINIIISVFSSLFPAVSIFIVLLLPLTSVLVEIYCKDRYYPIYAFATFGLALVATLWNMETTIFYLLPSLITGYVFGLLNKLKVPPLYSIITASLIQMGFTFISIPLINFIFDVDIIMTFKTVFNLVDSENIDVIIPSFIFVISLIQTSLSYAIISNEFNKLSIDENHSSSYQWIYQCLIMALLIVMIAISFVSLKIAYILLLIAIYFAVFVIIDFIEEKYFYTLIVFAFGLVINIIVFALINEKMPINSSLLLIGITPFWIGFISTIVSFLKRKSNKVK